jgi:urease accessory protein
MLRATSIVKSASLATAFADIVVLDYDMRRRRRVTLKGRGGLSFLLDLAEAPDLKAGDALLLEDGRSIRVEAASERLMEIRCTDPQHLARLSWHIGNRHLKAEILADVIRIRADHVIGDMAEGLGAHVRVIDAPFDPERGAYHGGHSHAHD